MKKNKLFLHIFTLFLLTILFIILSTSFFIFFPNKIDGKEDEIDDKKIGEENCDEEKEFSEKDIKEFYSDFFDKSVDTKNISVGNCLFKMASEIYSRFEKKKKYFVFKIGEVSIYLNYLLGGNKKFYLNETTFKNENFITREICSNKEEVVSKIIHVSNRDVQNEKNVTFYSKKDYNKRDYNEKNCYFDEKEEKYNKVNEDDWVVKYSESKEKYKDKIGVLPEKLFPYDLGETDLNKISSFIKNANFSELSKEGKKFYRIALVIELKDIKDDEMFKNFYNYMLYLSQQNDLKFKLKKIVIKIFFDSKFNIFKAVFIDNYVSMKKIAFLQHKNDNKNNFIIYYESDFKKIEKLMPATKEKNIDYKNVRNLFLNLDLH